MLKFQRSVHTRAKRVSVQLLKDFQHVGVRGEVVQVSEGLMRNKLHPGNGAVYLVDGPVIPIVKKAVKVSSTKPQKVQETKVEEKKRPSVLDMLVFDQADAATPAATEPAHQPEPQAKKPGFEWQNEFVKPK